MSFGRHFILTLAGGLVCAAQLDAQQSTGTIRGRVTDVATQQPLSGVTVAAGSRAAQTLNDGRYVVRGVPAGSYSVKARMIGYASAEQ